MLVVIINSTHYFDSYVHLHRFGTNLSLGRHTTGNRVLDQCRGNANIACVRHRNHLLMSIILISIPALINKGKQETALYTG